MKIEVSEKELNQIVQILAKQPFVDVFQLISNLQAQAQENKNNGKQVKESKVG